MQELKKAQLNCTLVISNSSKTAYQAYVFRQFHADMTITRCRCNQDNEMPEISKYDHQERDETVCVVCSCAIAFPEKADYFEIFGTTANPNQHLLSSFFSIRFCTAPKVTAGHLKYKIYKAEQQVLKKICRKMLKTKKTAANATKPNKSLRIV